MDLCQQNTKPGKTGTPDKGITYLFGKAVSAALPFYIAGRFHLEISRLSLFYEE